jgi:proteic killer suppression protein
MLLPFGLQLPVIASFAHKGLERFYRTGNISGVQAIHAESDAWSVTVQANWRVTFRFENGNAHVVNYEDYH